MIDIRSKHVAQSPAINGYSSAPFDPGLPKTHSHGTRTGIIIGLIVSSAQAVL